MKNHIKSIAIGAALFTFAGIGCSSDDSGPLGNVESLIILQRPKRNDNGDIFQYTSYIPGARLVQLSPPTADGTLTTICCDQDPDFKKARDNWATMTEADRIAVLKKAAKYQAETYGIPAADVEAHSPKNPDGTLRRQRMGEYSHADGKLKISREAMQDKGFDKVLDTVVHENGHRYQHTLVDKLNKTPPEIKPGDPEYDQAVTFDQNAKYYVQPKIKSTDAPTPDRGDEYFTQPQETHSRRTGEGIAAAGIGK